MDNLHDCRSRNCSHSSHVYDRNIYSLEQHGHGMLGQPASRPGFHAGAFSPHGVPREDFSHLERSNDPFWIALQQQLRPERDERRHSHSHSHGFPNPPFGARPHASYYSQASQYFPTTFPPLMPVDNNYLDILASHLDPHGHAPLLFEPESRGGQQQARSGGVDSNSSGQRRVGPVRDTDSNETIADQPALQQAPRPAKAPKAARQARKQKAAAPSEDEPEEVKAAPRKRKPRAPKVLQAEEVKVEKAEQAEPPRIKPVARKRTKSAAESDPESEGDEGGEEAPMAKKCRSRSGAKPGGSFDSLRPMRRPRRSAREKRSVGGSVLPKVPKKPLSEAASRAAAAKAEQERQRRRNAWWCITETKASGQADKGDWQWQPKAPASFMRRPKIQGFNDPLLPPATDSEADEDQGDGGWTGKSRANDTELKEKTLLNYTLSHFQVRQIMSRHLTDDEMLDCEKSMLMLLEANMEIILQLDYRDLWYLEETYVRQAAIHGKFLEGMLLPGVVINRVGMIMYATESFCDMIQRTPQETNMASLIEVFDVGFLRQDSKETIRSRVSMRSLPDIYGLCGVISCIIMPYTHQPDPNTNMDSIVRGVTFL